MFPDALLAAPLPSTTSAEDGSIVEGAPSGKADACQDPAESSASSMSRVPEWPKGWATAKEGRNDGLSTVSTGSGRPLYGMRSFAESDESDTTMNTLKPLPPTACNLRPLPDAPSPPTTCIVKL
mmetsp:Transcript_15697/g.53596  ORF Transcript_15697/g.53596 Transcript_15697/m.53596 type:complete len:124 (+) Transcript_15697:2147-2518(+)